jgi:hypothetical protein
MPNPTHLFADVCQTLPGKACAAIKDLDEEFENAIVRMTANRRYEERIKIGKTVIGPLEEGEEFEVRYWAGRELARLGIARFREDDKIDLVSLHRVHWMEMVQSGKQVSPLPDRFYPRVRRLLKELSAAMKDNPSRVEEYEKARRIADDIVSCRTRKIMALAAAQVASGEILKNLSREERELYSELFDTFGEWKREVLQLE